MNEKDKAEIEEAIRSGRLPESFKAEIELSEFLWKSMVDYQKILDERDNQSLSPDIILGAVQIFLAYLSTSVAKTFGYKRGNEPDKRETEIIHMALAFASTCESDLAPLQIAGGILGLHGQRIRDAAKKITESAIKTPDYARD